MPCTNTTSRQQSIGVCQSIASTFAAKDYEISIIVRCGCIWDILLEGAKLVSQWRDAVKENLRSDEDTRLAE